ncbi:MAG: STAS domain-containing protein [Gomphosphaeria aponina SAG 52.96 = DSM 107014]|uniref:Anti-sigma factor antagonist n=1 Tax=Gomphosphaeria aponina SAG 52.96 = DSM 107014 TaxID=1521640 RepID=A0A941GUS1_9CHRO|nr:STAS domain-containing protein [Gomphosphaeria aponina SAG 52.96 = DSM 107014]
MNPKLKIIEPEGIFDKNKATEYRQLVNESLAAGSTIILLDLQKVTFMDSGGLGGLVMIRKAVIEAQSQLFLCSLNEQIKILFELTSMELVFNIFDNQEAFQQKIINP